MPFLLIVFVLLWINGGPVVLAPVAGIAALVAVHHWTNIGSEAEQERSMALTQMQSNRLNEAVEVLEMIKSTRTELRVLNRFERVFDEFAYSSHVSRLWQSLAGYANITIGQAMIAMVLIIGAYEISAGNMTVGGLLTCSLLVGRIIAPIGQLVGCFHRASQSRALLKSLAEEARFESESAGDDSGALPAPQECALRLNGISFSYSAQGARQIDNISATIQPGERIAIVGRSGSGKSTLLRLIARLAEPDQGSILLDGFDVRQYAPAALRDALGYMGQTTGIVDDTLMKNLVIGLHGGRSRALQRHGAADRRGRIRRAAIRRASACRSARAASGCPAASVSRSRWRERCWRIQRSCCSMSRRPRWIRCSRCAWCAT